MSDVDDVVFQHVVFHIKISLLGDVLGEDGGLGDVQFKSSILLEDTLQFSQDLK